MTESQLTVSSSSQKHKKFRHFLRRNQKTIVISSVIFLISMIYNLTVNRIFILDIDEAHLIKRIMAVLTGEIPLINFKKFTYAPGHYWFFGFFFKLFGPSIMLERLLWVILRSLVNVITYLLSKYLVPKFFVFLPVVLALLMPSISYKTMVPFLAMLNLYALFLYIDKKNNKWLILAGAVSGLTLWFRQDIGIFSLVNACVCIFFQHVSIEKLSLIPLRMRFRSHLKKVLAKQGLFCLTFVLSFLPLVVFYGTHGRATTFIWDMFLGGPLKYFSRKGRMPRQFPNIEELFQIPLDWDVIFLWIPVFIFVFAFFLLSYRFIKQKGFTTLNLFLWATLIMSVLTFNLTVQNAIFERILENAVPMYILVAYILAWKYEKIKTSLESRKQGGIKTTTIKCAAIVLLLSMPVSFIVHGLTRKNINDRLIYRRRPNDIVRSDTGVWLVKGQLQRKIRVVRRTIWEGSHKDDHIVFINTALIFFHSTRKGLVDHDIQIEYFNEDNLSQYFDEFNPKYVAVENWALKYFRWLSESFQQHFTLNYTPIANRAGHTVFCRNQD